VDRIFFCLTFALCKEQKGPPKRAVCFLFLVARLAALAGILCLLAGLLIWVLTLLAGLLVWILTLLTWFIVGHRVSFRVGEQRTTVGSFVRSKKNANQWNFFDVPNAAPCPGRSPSTSGATPPPAPAPSSSRPSRQSSQRTKPQQPRRSHNQPLFFGLQQRLGPRRLANPALNNHGKFLQIRHPATAAILHFRRLAVFS
jgi:hypothetical protein